MKEKLRIRICAGTNCYILGGADLLTLEEVLPEELREEVEIEGCTCLSYCKDAKYGKPPFVVVGDEVISEASLPKVIEKIRNIIRKEK